MFRRIIIIICRKVWKFDGQTLEKSVLEYLQLLKNSSDLNEALRKVESPVSFGEDSEKGIFRGQKSLPASWGAFR